MASFPDAIWSTSNPAGNDKLSTGHASQHGDVNDEVEAMQQELGTNPSYRLCPTGCYIAYGGDTAPNGFLFCNGGEHSRTGEADLFAVIGTKYGVGDGSTTFNVPLMDGRTSVGLDSGDSDLDTIGKIHGAKDIALTIAKTPPHEHTVDVDNTAANGTGQSVVDGPGGGTRTSSSVGGGESHENMQPSLVGNFIIKT